MPPSVAAGWSAAQSAPSAVVPGPSPGPAGRHQARRPCSRRHGGLFRGATPFSERLRAISTSMAPKERAGTRKGRPRRPAISTHVFVPAEAWSWRGCGLAGRAHSVRRVAPASGTASRRLVLGLAKGSSCGGQMENCKVQRRTGRGRVVPGQVALSLCPDYRKGSEDNGC